MDQPVSAHVANGVLRGSSSDLYFNEGEEL